MKLWLKIVLAMLAGGAAGLLIDEVALHLKPVGTLFLNLIQMIVGIIVLFSITVGVTAIGDTKKLGRVGVKTLLYYLANTLIAILSGLLLASQFEIGSGLSLVAPHSLASVDAPSFSSLMLSMVSSNPFLSLYEGNMIQIIFFALFLGFAINRAGEVATPLLSIFSSLSEVMLKLTGFIMELAPIGVFAIMAWTMGTFGIKALLPLLHFLAIYTLGCFIQLLFVFGGGLKLIAKLPIIPFFVSMRESILIAFSSCSSSAALPSAMQAAEENLGVSKSLVSFILPLGSTVNMAGAALFQAMSTLFIANAYGITLDTTQLLTLIFTATLSAIGAAGVPGTGFIMLSAVITSIGLPVEGLVLLAGVDRIREMLSTVVNSLGDSVVAVIIAKGEGELDEARYLSVKSQMQKDSAAAEDRHPSLRTPSPILQ